MKRLLVSVVLAAMMPLTVSGAIVYSGSQNVVLQLSPSSPMASAPIELAQQGEQWDDFQVNLWLETGMMSTMDGMHTMSMMSLPSMSMLMMPLDTRLAIHAPGMMSTGMGMGMGMAGFFGFLDRAMSLPLGGMLYPHTPVLDWAYLYNQGGIDDEGGYIGIMTPDGRYGWLHILSQSGIGTETHSVIFDGWAYEERPGVPVAAGEGPCDWFPGGPHKMHWPQPPELSPAGIDVSDIGTVLADDFKCTASGPISRIHIWGSFADDVVLAGADKMTFEVSICADAPAASHIPSHPGTTLWTRTFAPGQYAVRMIHDGPEGWCDPLSGSYQADNHRQAYQFNFCVDKDALVQQEGTVYWLVVKVPPTVSAVSAAPKFGWKSTCPGFRWNHDAVYVAADGSWRTLAYPTGHEAAGQSLDLAFVIDSGRDLQARYDLGDAPDSSNSLGTEMTAYPKNSPPGVPGSFPTVYQAGSPPYGPLHRDPKGTAFLGYGVTLENEADLGPDADPTNNLNPTDDLADADASDDGVVVPLTLPDSKPTTFDYVVTVINPQATRLYVNVWFDWNRDGDWDDTMLCADGATAPEWAVQNQELNLPGIGPHTVTTPEFRSWHPLLVDDLDPIWMRITLSETPWSPSFGAGGSGPANGYALGETEDYYFQPKNEPAPATYDWGDAPKDQGGSYATLEASNGARHAIAGPWLGDSFGGPDAEADGRPDPNALGDDNDGNDDEDGVWIPPLVQGEPADITLEVSGGGGIVQAWIDFDADESWAATEEVYNGYLPDGIHTITIFVPPDAIVDQSFARFRISSKGGLTSKGAAPDGEVEDYAVSIRAAPAQLKWAQWPDLTFNGIDIRADNSDGKTRWLADDFKCTSTNRITEVRLWGSWKGDRQGKIEKINLAIQADDPAGAAGADPQNRFSKPAPTVLWSRSFSPTEFKETSYHLVRDLGEWWWDPATGQLTAGGDTEVWQIDISISPSGAFLQQGTPADPVIYWLRVQVETTDGQFGWKTRRWPDHYADDAVWDVAADKPAAWKELRYPKGHPYYCLEKNSVDLAFLLTYTEEVIEYPTMRPGSVTQCPVVATQCPAVATQCPAVKTQCPMYATRCPTVKTKCPALSTQCPLVATKCPVVKTKCPTKSTYCPPVKTKCPVVATRCPESLTKCPPTPTKCRVIETQCPTVTTKCPPTITECQAVDTQCPAVTTKCPEVLTRCPPTPTQCQTVQTQCPVVSTECQSVQTQCPALATQCPVVATQCPESLTKCPPVTTQCPTTDTKCPWNETKCPVVQTQCPVVNTQCPSASTSCPVVSTACPPAPTQCPGVLTQCPPTPTKCQTVDTQCPAYATRCPVVETQCPPTVTACQAVDTQCPATATECPVVETQCPATPTKCKVVDTQCPVYQTKCPPTLTECYQKETECPAVQTQCPPVSTRCPVAKTKCPPCPNGTLAASSATVLPCPALDVPCPSVVVAKR
jgi:hypothetical protein